MVTNVDLAAARWRVELASRRQWLQETVFVDAPAGPSLTLRRAAVITLIAGGSVVILLLRMWRSSPLNSIWGEDGYIFLSDAIHRGFLHSLVLPYNGYLQTSSRLVAEPISRLPVTWFAPSMAVAGAVIVTVCALLVWRSSSGLIKNPYLRAALASMVVLLPVVGVETLDNVVNTIWFLFFLTFWVLLWRPSTAAGASAAGAFLFLAAVSNGGVVLLAPLWLLRLVAMRDRRDTIMVSAFAVGIVVQFSYSWNHLNQLGEGSKVATSSAICELTKSACSGGGLHLALLPAYAQRVVGGALAGQTVSAYLWIHLGSAFEVILAALLVLILVLVIVRTHGAPRFLVPFTVAMSILVFLVSGYQRWTSAGRLFLWPSGSSPTSNAHYMVVPSLLLLSAVFIFLDVQHLGSSAHTWSLIRGTATGLVILGALVSFNVADRQMRGTPTWSRALAAASAMCGPGSRSEMVEINPSNVFVIAMPIPCARIR
jgi:hypothetical protein